MNVDSEAVTGLTAPGPPPAAAGPGLLLPVLSLLNGPDDSGDDGPLSLVLGARDEEGKGGGLVPCSKDPARGLRLRWWLDSIMRYMSALDTPASSNTLASACKERRSCDATTPPRSIRSNQKAGKRSECTAHHSPASDNSIDKRSPPQAG